MVQKAELCKEEGIECLNAWGPHVHSFFQATMHASFEQRATAAQALQHPFLAVTVASLRPVPE